ncbi:MAG TPA: thiamine phosphate synthase [Gaiellaceae bacterium]|nr:thiamine phosphate synthase [Gaiellaceae bacterium]
MATDSSSRGPSPAADAAREARLYLVTGARPDLAAFLEAAVRGGVDIVQLREKELPDGELVRVLEEARAVTRRLAVPLVVNDRPDLAVLVGADYVHVGQDDLPLHAVRRFGIPAGLSTHSRAELEAAEADYVAVGPVFATPTKPGRPAVGLELVRHAAERAPAPWFAIGGIGRTNVAEVVAAGARRIAVVRAIGDAGDPEAAARELREALPG